MLYLTYVSKIFKRLFLCISKLYYNSSKPANQPLHCHTPPPLPASARPQCISAPPPQATPPDHQSDAETPPRAG
jgi:hypothetical protein